MNNQSYYDLFIEMGEHLDKAIKTTSKSLNHFKVKDLPKQMEKVHTIESEGDEITHKIMQRLTKDFITPLEREDIINLAYELDDVIDSVEEILQKLYMYNIKTLTPVTIEFFKIIEKCGKELHTVLKELANFKKSKTIRNSIIEINRLEELADDIYLEAMHKLYQQTDKPIDIISWTHIYNSLEKCCDMCESVADSIDSIIMKNL